MLEEIDRKKKDGMVIHMMLTIVNSTNNYNNRIYQI